MGVSKNIMAKIKKALISVYDKKYLKTLLTTLKKFKIEIISSGGTFKEIKKLGYVCTEISNYTNSPEILNGRVKTLHPKIHGGILNQRKNKKHLKDLRDNKIKNIDLVVVNFYPFEEVIKNKLNHNMIIENIDIGGPTMVRAAAKNYNDVTVISSTNQYEELIQQLKNNNGSTSLDFRKKMSQNAFSETAYYDSLIVNYFNKFTNNHFPEKKIFHSKLIKKLRYGENPHQESAIYSTDKSLNLNQLSGKQLSYNNLNDIYTALAISKSFPKNAGVVIIKHANPCGVSINKDKIKCYQSALTCDPISAFGGIVLCNFNINKKLALELNKIFFEVIIANKFDKDSLRILKKKKNLRLIDSSNFSFNQEFRISSHENVILFQKEDNITFDKNHFTIVSKKKPTKQQMKNLIFAFNMCRYVKSNAIVLAQNESTIGIGSGQPSRIDSCKIAINKMKKIKKNYNDVVAASDAFFPFTDGIQKLVQSGITAIIQPSGSINDKDIVKFANNTNTVLVFSKTRHFRH